jgi:hypothetical protein
VKATSAVFVAHGREYTGESHFEFGGCRVFTPIPVADCDAGVTQSLSPLPELTSLGNVECPASQEFIEEPGAPVRRAGRGAAHEGGDGIRGGSVENAF